MDNRLSISIFKALIIVGVFTTLKFFFYDKLNNPNTGLDGLSKVEKIDWLLIGASHIEAGYDIEMLSKATGQSFYKIWAPGIDPMEIAVVLEEILRIHGSKICNVMVDVSTSLLDKAPAVPRESNWFYEASVPLKVKMLNSYTRYPQSFIKISELLLSGNTSSFIVQLFRGSNSSVDTLPATIINEIDQKSWGQYIKYRRQTKPAKIDPIYLEGLTRTAKILNDLYPGKSWITQTPTPIFIIEELRYQSLKNQLTEILKPYTSLNYADMATLNFPIGDHRNFADWHHLSSAGKKMNTEIFLKNVVNYENNKKYMQLTNDLCR